MIVSAFVGIFLSGVLLKHHLDPYSKSAIVEAVCGAEGASDCEQVNRSDASIFLGLPIAFWGFIYYGIVFVLALFYYKVKENSLLKIIFSLSALAIVVDIGLLLYSLIVIERVCNLCLITYLCTITILTCVIILLNKNKVQKKFQIIPDFSWLVSKSTVFIVLFLFSLFSVFLIDAFIYVYAKSSTGPRSNNPSELLQQAWESFKKQYDGTDAKEIPVKHSAYKGASDPIITIVEFSDFLCGHCKKASSKIKDIFEKYENSVRIVYKHFPLDKECNQNIKRDFHNGSCKLSYASFCAQQSDMNKFWKIHDSIFEKQGEFLRKRSVTDSDLNAIFNSAGLNVSQMNACIKRGSTKKTIVDDIELGNKLNVSGTPSIFINGKRVRSLPIDYFLDRLLRHEAQRKFGSIEE